MLNVHEGDYVEIQLMNTVDLTFIVMSCKGLSLVEFHFDPHLTFCGREQVEKAEEFPILLGAQSGKLYRVSSDALNRYGRIISRNE